jgi:hypothetical protein
MSTTSVFHKILEKKYKKPPKLIAVWDRAPQCSEGTKVASQLLKCIKNATYFFIFL